MSIPRFSVEAGFIGFAVVTFLLVVGFLGVLLWVNMETEQRTRRAGLKLTYYWSIYNQQHRDGRKHSTGTAPKEATTQASTFTMSSISNPRQRKGNINPSPLSPLAESYTSREEPICNTNENGEKDGERTRLIGEFEHEETSRGSNSVTEEEEASLSEVPGNGSLESDSDWMLVDEGQEKKANNQDAINYSNEGK